MNTATLPSVRNHQFLNNLYVTFEYTSIPLMLFSFFDAELIGVRGLVNAASYGIVLVLIALRWKECARLAKLDVSLVLLVGMVMASVLWSASPDATNTVSKAVLRSTLIGLYIATRFTPLILMRLLAWVFGFAGVVSLLVGVAIPAIGVAYTNGEESWKGILTHKQYLGRMMLHACWLYLVSMLGGRRLRWLAWFGLLLSALLLLLSKSKTSWVASCTLPFLLPMLYFVRWPYRARTIVYVVVGMLLIGVGTFLLLDWQTIVVEILKKPPDLNGRLPIWVLVIQRIWERPWIGFGYGGFWPSLEGQQIIYRTWAALGDALENPQNFHSHSGFLEVLTHVGVIGMTLLTINFVGTLIRVLFLIHQTKSVEAVWMLGFLIILLIFNFADTLTFISLHSLWSIYVAIDYMTIIWRRSLEQPPEQLETPYLQEA